MRMLIAAALGGMVTTSQALAQEAGDPARGLDLSRKVCGSCHAVAAREVLSPVAGAPTFDEVADRPGVTGMGLTAFLRTPHRTMPDLILRPAEIDDVVAHILSLKNGD